MQESGRPTGPESLESIKIPRLVLKEKVDIEGRDIFGQQALLTLHPTDKPGWYWRVDGQDIAITVDMLVSRSAHYLSLNYKQHELKVVEHLLPLRFTGLDSVVIESPNNWTPYDAGGINFWLAVENKIKYDGELTPTNFSVAATHNEQGKKFNRILTYDPNKTGKLEVRAIIDYKKYGGKADNEISLPLTDFKDPQGLIKFFTARTLGQPQYLSFFLEQARKLGWPHYKNIVWEKSGASPQQILEEIGRHRMLDFLGAMAVLPNAGEYLVGSFFSDKGNHASDVKLLKAIKIANNLS
jgi:UDP-3-O-acyl-N-acetylglucosamine deacetylase